MTRPTVSAAAERIYARLAAYHEGDEDNGWVLLHMCEAAARTLAKANDVLRYDEHGSGWRRMRDPDRCPAWALPWLANHVGIDLPASASEAEQRQLIRAAPGLSRGTPLAITTAGQRTLTGTKYLRLKERSDPAAPGVDKAYHLTVVTHTDETPDPAVTLAALLSQKPAGLVLHHQVVAGVLIDDAPTGTKIDDVAAGVKIDNVTQGDL